MEYTISSTRRKLIIFSAVFLILKAVIILAIFFLSKSAQLNNTLRIILSILQIIPYGYIMIVIADYFNHYKLKLLRTTTLIVFVTEIAGNMLQYFNHGVMFNQAELTVPRFIAIGNGMIWTLIMIVWIILLVRISASDFPALISIRKYAISVFAVLLLSTTLPFFIGHIRDIQQYLGIIVAMIGVLPNVFFIEFGLKLPGKVQNPAVHVSKQML